MASIIAHICISNIVKDELRLSDKFLTGSVIPDLKRNTGIDENITHYLKYKVSDDGSVFHLPDLEKFIEENTFKLLDFKTLGYYAHLIEDNIWFEKFIGKYIKWHDDNLGLVTNLKTGKVYEYDTFKKQIHDDYSVINNKLISKYKLDIKEIFKKISENLSDEKMINEIKQALQRDSKACTSKKVNFISDEDIDEYILLSTK